MKAGGAEAPPGGLVFRLSSDPEGDAAIEGYRSDLDVESIAVLVRPGAADSRPEAFSALAGIENLVDEVAG